MTATRSIVITELTNSDGNTEKYTVTYRSRLGNPADERPDAVFEADEGTELGDIFRSVDRNIGAGALR